MSDHFMHEIVWNECRRIPAGTGGVSPMLSALVSLYEAVKARDELSAPNISDDTALTEASAEWQAAEERIEKALDAVKEIRAIAVECVGERKATPR